MRAYHLHFLSQFCSQYSDTLHPSVSPPHCHHRSLWSFGMFSTYGAPIAIRVLVPRSLPVFVQLLWDFNLGVAGLRFFLADVQVYISIIEAALPSSHDFRPPYYLFHPFVFEGQLECTSAFHSSRERQFSIWICTLLMRFFFLFWRAVFSVTDLLQNAYVPPLSAYSTVCCHHRRTRWWTYTWDCLSVDGVL